MVKTSFYFTQHKQSFSYIYELSFYQKFKGICDKSHLSDLCKYMFSILLYVPDKMYQSCPDGYSLAKSVLSEDKGSYSRPLRKASH